MSTWIKRITNSTNTRWFTVLLSILAILLSGLAGGLVSGGGWFLAGNKTLVLLGLLGLGPILLLSAVKFDFMVLVNFCLFSVVQMEPAPTDMLVMLLLLVGLLTGKLSLKGLTGSSLVHLSLWGFLVANLVSLVYVNAVLDGLGYLLITAYLIAFLYFVKMYITSSQAMRTVMIGYLVSAMLAVVLVSLGYLGIGTELFIRHGARAKGPFKDPNVFGPFLIPMVIFLLDEIVQPKIILGLRSAKVLATIALTAGVFLCGSRAAWANLAFSLLIYLILVVKSTSWTKVAHLPSQLRVKTIRLLILLVAGSLALVLILKWPGFLQFVQAFVAERLKLQVYDTTRFARQVEGINAGLTHLVGVGPGMWISAHSLYVRAFAEQGIFGLVSLVLCLLVLLMGALSRALREVDKPYGLSAKVVVASLGGLLVNSIVIDTAHWRHFWFILGLAWVMTTLEHPVSSSYVAG